MQLQLREAALRKIDSQLKNLNRSKPILTTRLDISRIADSTEED